MWVQNSENQFIDAVSLEKCRGRLKLEDFRGKSAYAGLDLSSGGDLTSLALDFDTDVGGCYQYSKSYMQLTMYRYLDHNTNEWVDKAILIADGKTLDANAFVIVKKGAAPAQG